jgi:hypothetical protein
VPVSIHNPIPLPTPSDPLPLPRLPVTIDGLPSDPVNAVNGLIPNPPFPLTPTELLSERGADFLKKHGGELVTGCLGGGIGGVLLFDAAGGGVTIVMPGIGEVTQGGAALGGCIAGAAGTVVSGVNPIRRN